MHATALLPRPTQLPLAAVLALLCGAAFAQTPPRYTARDLTKPTAALYCGGPMSINDRGDAHQSCTYKVGSYTTTTKFCLDYLPICYPMTTTTQVTKQMPAVWPAGATVKALDVTALSSSWGSVLMHSGEVLAQGSGMTTKGASTGPFMAWRWLPPYAGTGQVVAKPTALLGQDFEMMGATQGGTQWWRTLDGQRHAQLAPDGVLTYEPKVTAALATGEEAIEEQVVGVQDGDQAVHTRIVRLAANSGFRFELWYRQGQQWLRIPAINEQWRTEAVAIARNGRVLWSQQDATYTWQASQPTSVITLNGAGGMVINGSGVVGGSVPILNDSKNRSKAVLWWQGQPFDLQGLTTGLPSKSWMLRGVMAINDRGQMLVSADDTSKTGTASYKTVLLTPQ